MNSITQSIFTITNKQEFEIVALAMFNYQAEHCEVYKQYLQHLGIKTEDISNVASIPFLPIEFFKSHRVYTQSDATTVFLSSATTGSIQSKHYVSDISMYETSYIKGFESFYGNINNYVILALLPSYAEREGSSLIYMVNDLINQSNKPQSGFYHKKEDELATVLQELSQHNVPAILIGVSYALLDFFESHPMQLSENIFIMETGGMKGRREELTREELHSQLVSNSGKATIHSEYGMTELLSQAYSKGNGIFACPPWMKILLRDTDDPLTNTSKKQTGGINVIDLANVNSCSFIATQDVGRIFSDGTFEVLGRFDYSDVRGCSLLLI